MKIAVCSDLHLEFGYIELKNTEGADVLILSGDILVAEDLRRYPEDKGMYAPLHSYRYVNSAVYRDFFNFISKQFPVILYVAGNHEFYDGKWLKTLKVLQDECSDYSNIHFLEDSTYCINDVTFIGCTLWTDMNNHDPLTQQSVRTMMNDYAKITNDEREYCKLRPIHTIGRHLKSKQYIKHVITEKPDEKFVVIGHHAPSFQSIPDEYKGHYLTNGAYASDLSEFILDHPQIKLWTHGHIHDVLDYNIGDTRIFCNPRGYRGYEQRAKEFELKYVEI